MNSAVDNSTADLFEEEILPNVLPVVIIIAILTILGVTGNAIIIYIFGFVLKASTVYFFITLLAIFDFVCCAFDFPMEIIEFLYILRYPSNANCKFQRLVSFTCSIGSVIMLLVISIERYRKVCCAVRSELTSLHRKIFAVGVVILSLALASPIVVFSQKRPFTHHFFPNHSAAVCSEPSFKSNPFVHYYLMAIFLFFIIALIIMLTFYYRVWRTAKKHFVMARNRQRNGDCAGAEPSVAQKRLSRTNRSLIASTVLFAISFIPTPLLNIIVVQLPRFFDNFSVEVAYFALIRLFLLNSSFNPLVYGYFNEQFRYETRKMLSKILRMKTPSTVDFSTENTP